MKNFNDITISTKTIIGISNISIDITKLFEMLPITPYIVTPVKRGRKKKEEFVDPNKDIKEGSIVSLKYINNIRGVNFKKKKKQKKYFRNAVTTVMSIDNKLVNFKITNNGKFQLTGCKNEIHAQKAVQYIWMYIKDTTDIYTFNEGNKNFKFVYYTVMTNIDFNVGYSVNRENLDSFINSSQMFEFNSLLEPSFGYTGVNIKIPYEEPKHKKYVELSYKNRKWHYNIVGHEDFLSLLSPVERKKQINKKNKQGYNTFLVFYSGNVIMSGRHPAYMKKVYYRFMKIMKEYRPFVEELNNY